ncbi:DUF6799 domain-containing protein [Adhaeribacter soli]|uniref:DUF6799 domain-containing protein n=1 Tax=Adhaeribacter soli TaxID=2607655 RepID=A0A5N1J1P0_9BACT|nr:DUF6799 domain-containing protein [Adhaeribacter soli]KAA9340703.1 hypothetical protein F0P94_04560 [Adhaeribacter soli]
MKNLVSVLAGFLFVFLACTSTQAQSTSGTGTEVTRKSKAKGEMSGTTTMPSNAMREGVMMEGDKILITRNGQTTIMTKDTTFANGTMIMSNGMVKMADGTTMNMKNGDRMDMNGNMMQGRMSQENHEGHDHMRTKTEKDGDVKMKSDTEKLKIEKGKKKKG